MWCLPGSQVTVNLPSLCLHCSGGRAGGPCPSQDSWHLSVTEGQWRQLPFCSAGRAWSAMAPLTALEGGIVVLFGGIDAMNRQTLAVGSILRTYLSAANQVCVSVYVRAYIRGMWQQRRAYISTFCKASKVESVSAYNCAHFG